MAELPRKPIRLTADQKTAVNAAVATGFAPLLNDFTVPAQVLALNAGSKEQEWKSWDAANKLLSTHSELERAYKQQALAGVDLQKIGEMDMLEYGKHLAKSIYNEVGEEYGGVVTLFLREEFAQALVGQKFMMFIASQIGRPTKLEDTYPKTDYKQHAMEVSKFFLIEHSQKDLEALIEKHKADAVRQQKIIDDNKQKPIERLTILGKAKLELETDQQAIAEYETQLKHLKGAEKFLAENKLKLKDIFTRKELENFVIFTRDDTINSMKLSQKDVIAGKFYSGMRSEAACSGYGNPIVIHNSTLLYDKNSKAEAAEKEMTRKEEILLLQPGAIATVQHRYLGTASVPDWTFKGAGDKALILKEQNARFEQADEKEGKPFVLDTDIALQSLKFASFDKIKVKYETDMYVSDGSRVIFSNKAKAKDDVELTPIVVNASGGARYEIDPAFPRLTLNIEDGGRKEPAVISIDAREKPRIIQSQSKRGGYELRLAGDRTTIIIPQKDKSGGVPRKEVKLELRSGDDRETIKLVELDKDGAYFTSDEVLQDRIDAATKKLQDRAKAPKKEEPKRER